MTTTDHQPTQPVTEYWDWQLSAACRGMNVETFYHPAGERWHQKNERITQAKRICQRCPVISQCATWALRTREEPGSSRTGEFRFLRCFLLVEPFPLDLVGGSIP